MAKKKAQKKNTKPEVVEALPELSERQLAFVLAYFENGGNGSAAYRKAYGANVKGAQESASRLLSNAMVLAFISARRQSLVEKFDVTEDRIVQRLAAHAFTSFGDLMREDPGYRAFRLKDWAVMDPRHAMAIKSFSESTGESESQSVTMHSPEKAIELLVKYLNLFPNAKGSKKDDGAGRGTARAGLKDAVQRLREKLMQPGPGDPGGGTGSNGSDIPQGSK